jgi:hypothetical protein
VPTVPLEDAVLIIVGGILIVKLVDVYRYAAESARSGEVPEPGGSESPVFGWAANRIEPVRTIVGVGFRLPALIVLTSSLLFVLGEADASLQMITAVLGVAASAAGMCFYLVLVMVTRRERSDIARRSGYELHRTVRQPSPAQPLHPLIVVLGITAILVLAYASLYHVISSTEVSPFGGAGAPAGGHAMGLVDSLYFSAITMATVGYGDIAPASEAARVAVLTQLAVGITLLSLFILSATRREQF